MTVNIDAGGITSSINQLAQYVSFTVGENVEAGDYIATISCGDAEPVDVTITVTAPPPPATEISANPTSLTIQTQNSGTTTITKSPDLAETDIAVSIDEETISTNIDQTTGVITFTIGDYTHTGDYVAEVTCGDAEPVAITITVTAPTTTSFEVKLYGSDTTTSAWTVNSVGSKRRLSIVRSPALSQSPVTYTMPQSEKFDIIINNYETFGESGNKAYMELKQITPTSPRESLEMVISCGEATSIFTINPK